MAINFPNDPIIGEAYILNGRRYFWDGVKWKGATFVVSSASGPFDRPGPTVFDVDFVAASTKIQFGIASYDGQPSLLSTYSVGV